MNRDMDEHPLDEGEVSTVEYARLYNLTKDHRSDMDVSFSVQPPTWDHALQEQEEVSGSDLTASLNAKENWTIDKGAARILQQIVQLSQKLETHESTDSELQRRRSLKVELPLLTEESETDLDNHWARTGLYAYQPEIEPQPPTHVCHGGITWSSQEWQTHAGFEAQICAERLQVSRDTLLVIQDVIRDDCTWKDKEETIRVEHTYAKVHTVLNRGETSFDGKLASRLAAHYSAFATAFDTIVQLVLVRTKPACFSGPPEFACCRSNTLLRPANYERRYD